jgi:purine-nucleoside phosphorylase
MSLAQAAARLQRLAGGPLDVAIVLGSGLSDDVRARIDGATIPYTKLGLPQAAIPGHPGVAVAGQWAEKRVVAFAGRVHLYEGYSARVVAHAVRLAAKAGARTIVLTNAAGGLNEEYARGDLMLVRDHINLTGTSPLGHRRKPSPFINMTDAYAPHLRALAQASSQHIALREGVYAGVTGPAYETPAEAAALRRLGADAVGMSLVIATIAARTAGLEVLGISVITNVLGARSEVSHEEVLEVARAGGERVSLLIEAVLGSL